MLLLFLLSLVAVAAVAAVAAVVAVVVAAVILLLADAAVAAAAAAEAAVAVAVAVVHVDASIVVFVRLHLCGFVACAARCLHLRGPRTTEHTRQNTELRGSREVNRTRNQSGQPEPS